MDMVHLSRLIGQIVDGHVSYLTTLETSNSVNNIFLNFLGILLVYKLMIKLKIIISIPFGIHFNFGN